MRGGVVASAFNGSGGRWWAGSVEREKRGVEARNGGKEIKADPVF